MSLPVAHLLKKYFFEKERFPDLYEIQSLNLNKAQRRQLFTTARHSLVFFNHLKKALPKISKKPSAQIICCLLLIAMQELLIHQQPLYHVGADLKKSLEQTKTSWFLKEGIWFLKHLPSLDLLWQSFFSDLKSYPLLDHIQTQNLSFDLRELFSHPPLWIRVDGKPEELTLSIPIEPPPYRGALLQETTQEIATLFNQGTISFQDLGAQALTEILSNLSLEPSTVIDCCAAPGGKATELLYHWPKAHFLLTDFSQKRLEHLKSNIARFEQDRSSFDIKIQHHDWTQNPLEEKADFILVDAPCTGVGVSRRHPDILWHKTPQSIHEATTKQSLILNNAASCLKPKSYLLHSTCSFLFEENDAVIKQFLQTNPQFKVQKLALKYGQATNYGWQLLPSEKHDGLYYCLLKNDLK